MTPVMTPSLTSEHDTARSRAISLRNAATLKDLMEQIEREEGIDTQLAAMLRATIAYLAMYCKRRPDQIGVLELTNDLRPGFRKYLQGLKKPRLQDPEVTEPKLKRLSIKSYLNYLRILVESAQRFGWTQHSPELERQWGEIRAAVSSAVGLRGIVGYAIRQGTAPATFTDKTLDDWAEQQFRRGREYQYVRDLKTQFRKRVLWAGLSQQLPKLSFDFPEDYGIRLEKFPEPLRTEARNVLEWKQAEWDPEMPEMPDRNRHCAATAWHLQCILSRLFGYEVKFLGRTPATLQDLLDEASLRKYVKWLITERQVRSVTLIGELRKLRPLGSHPLLENWKRNWLDKFISRAGTGSPMPGRRSAKKQNGLRGASWPSFRPDPRRGRGPNRSEAQGLARAGCPVDRMAASFRVAPAKHTRMPAGSLHCRRQPLERGGLTGIAHGDVKKHGAGP